LKRWANNRCAYGAVASPPGVKIETWITRQEITLEGDRQMWNPKENTDQENLQWAWLRAVEWGSWPMFILQPVAPIALLFFPWWSVILVLMVMNATWSFFVRYQFVIPSFAFWGAIFVRIKWITIPFATYLLWRNDMRGIAALALFWPLVILIIPHSSTQIGIIQTMFMQCMGYEPTNREAIK
jgi:hypothetical protein